MGKKREIIEEEVSEEQVVSEPEEEEPPKRKKKDRKKRSREPEPEEEQEQSDDQVAWADIPMDGDEASAERETRPPRNPRAPRPTLDPLTPIGEVSLEQGLAYYRDKAWANLNPTAGDTLSDLLKCLKSRGGNGGGRGRNRNRNRGSRQARHVEPAKPLLPNTKGLYK